jgi:two-component system, LuxR family, sensor kinase FixL
MAATSSLRIESGFGDAAPAVLVVDDDPGTRRSVQRILSLDGYRVDLAGTAAEALDRRNWDEYLAVLLDRRLPDGSAEELLPELKRLAPDAAVLVVTGFGDLDSSIAALRAGAADYLLKPVEPETLRARIRHFAELRRTRRFAETLIDTAQAIILVRNAEGRIEWFNQFMEDLSGRTLEEVQGSDWFDTFVPEGERARVRQIFQTALAGKLIRGVSSTVVARDGSEREIAWWSKGLREPDGRVTSVLSTGHDITELRAAQQKLVQSERLAAIGQMVTGLAHESRNALQRAQACLDMLELDLDERPDLLDLTSRTRKALVELHRLYEEVRGYASPLHLEFAPVDIAELWRQSWANVVSVHPGRHVQLREEVAAGCDLAVHIDRHRLEQVFRNVFENSLAVCPIPGDVLVECAESHIGGCTVVRIAIRDNGPGLSPEQEQGIFEPFFTTKTRGTGLGMAIAKRFVEAHGGTIAARNAAAGGAEIVLTLPRSP